MPAPRLRQAILEWPWYPLLIGMLPALHFWQRNFRTLGPTDGVRFALLASVVALLLMTVLRWPLRSWGRAGLVAAPLMAVLVKGAALGVVASVALLVLAVALLVVLLVRKPSVGKVGLALNAAALVLVIMPVGTRLWTGRSGQPPVPTDLFSRPVDLPAHADRAADLPDVYFILADGLTQPAVARQLFGLTPRQYTEPLERLGARILHGSRSNYPQTGLSVAATFNLAPLPDLLTIPDPQSRDRRPLGRLMADNRAVRAMRDAGYQIVSYPSGYPLARLGDVDHRHAPLLGPTFLEFYALNEGVLPLLMRALGRGPADAQYDLHRARLDYILDRLPGARAGVPDDQPVFVYTHLLAPHPPFVWGPGGSHLSSRGLYSLGDANDWAGANPGETVPYGVFWKNQATHVMQRLEATVAAILAASPRPPVIIIQGDHGSGSQLDWDRPQKSNLDERFGIFNAWILPPDLEVPLRDDQTALATFPSLFEGLFGRPMGDVSEPLVFATLKRPYTFLALTADP